MEECPRWWRAALDGKGLPQVAEKCLWWWRTAPGDRGLPCSGGLLQVVGDGSGGGGVPLDGWRSAPGWMESAPGRMEE